MLQVVDSEQTGSRGGAQLLGALLGAGAPQPSTGTIGRPATWVKEAIHRSAALLRIYQRLELQAAPNKGTGHDLSWDWRMATRLRLAFDALTPKDQTRSRSCDTPLANICAALAGVLGPAGDRFAVTTDLESVSLPASRRRALVLSCSCLVIEALAQFVTDLRPRRLHIAMARDPDGAIVVTVADDGVAPCGFHASEAYPIVVEMAAVLEAELTCTRLPSHGYTMTLRFDAQPRAALPMQQPALAPQPSIRRRPACDTLGWLVSRVG